MLADLGLADQLAERKKTAPDQLAYERLDIMERSYRGLVRSAVAVAPVSDGAGRIGEKRE